MKDIARPSHRSSTVLALTGLLALIAPARASNSQIPTASAGTAIPIGTLALQPPTGCPYWLLTFEGASGLNDTALALTVFDDGIGPALYAGGYFTVAGGVPATRVAKWNGSTWSQLGTVINGVGGVYALTVFDDGNGPALYAAGATITPSVGFVKKWNGSSWTQLGGRMNGPDFSTGVHALSVFDDGGGPALYAGGYFTSAGGTAANCIAKWNGSSWSPLGSGMNNVIQALTVFDDGGGRALYAGGGFTNAGGAPAQGIAKWNGSTWIQLGSGVNSGLASSVVYTLTTFDDGSGPALYAGGGFTYAGGVAANSIAKWNGSTWFSLGGGVAGEVLALGTFDDGGGAALHASGNFYLAGGVSAKRIAKWNGSIWSALGSGMASPYPADPSVNALAVFDDGTGPALYAGGSFTTAGGVAENNIAKWMTLPSCGPSVVTSYCEPSSGWVIACPCGNSPISSGFGCDNSSGTGGSQITATGFAMLSLDTLVFTTTSPKTSASPPRLVASILGDPLCDPNSVHCG